MPENEHELDDEFEFEESEYPFEEWTPPTHQFTLAKVIQKVERLNIPDSTRKKYIDDIKTFFRITGCDDLEHCLKSFSKIKRALTLTLNDNE